MHKVLCLVAHYPPGHKAGGALRSVHNIAEAIGKKCNVRVLTSDRDLGDRESYTGVTINRWLEVGYANVYYSSRKIRDILEIIRRTDADTIYLNSFFDFHFSILPLIVWRMFIRRRVRLVIAPRGEFSRGALKIRFFKKYFFLLMVRLLRLYDGVIWHASTKYEADDIVRVINPKGADIRTIAVIPDIVSPTTVMIKNTQLILDRDPLKVCFISRISRKKNLDYALSVLRRVDIPVEFNVFGPPEDGSYLLYCHKLASDMPPNIVVNFFDSLNHTQVVETFGQHHLFFFPTKGENFGHVIAESLAIGTPVLISDQTPWVGLCQQGVGWDIPLVMPEEFVKAIKSITEMDSKAYQDMRLRASNYSIGSDINDVAKGMLFVFFGADY